MQQKEGNKSNQVLETNPIWRPGSKEYKRIQYVAEKIQSMQFQCGTALLRRILAKEGKEPACQVLLLPFGWIQPTTRGNERWIAHTAAEKRSEAQPEEKTRLFCRLQNSTMTKRIQQRIGPDSKPKTLLNKIQDDTPSTSSKPLRLWGCLHDFGSTGGRRCIQGPVVFAKPMARHSLTPKGMPLCSGCST